MFEATHNRFASASEPIQSPGNDRKRAVNAFEQASYTFTYGEKQSSSGVRRKAQIRFRDTNELRRSLSLPQVDPDGSLRNERKVAMIFGASSPDSECDRPRHREKRNFTAEDASEYSEPMYEAQPVEGAEIAYQSAEANLGRAENMLTASTSTCGEGSHSSSCHATEAREATDLRSLLPAPPLASSKNGENVGQQDGWRSREASEDTVVAEVAKGDSRDTEKEYVAQDDELRPWICAIGSDIHAPYFKGTARIIEIPASRNQEPSLAVPMSRELSTKIQSQLNAGTAYRRLREVVNLGLDEIDAKNRHIVAHHKACDERLRELLAGVMGRDPLEDEVEEGHRLAFEIEEAEEVDQQLLAERKRLIEQLRAARQLWLDAVESVEVVQHDIFRNARLIQDHDKLAEVVPTRTSAGTVVTKDPEKKISTAEPPQTTATAGEPPEEPKSDNVEQAQLLMRLCAARGALGRARDDHESYRKTYHRRLDAYICRYPSRPDIDVREDFTKQWLEDWGKIIQAVDYAEKQLKAVLDEAAVAGVTTDVPEADDEPYTPYDVDWLDEVLIANLDRRGLEGWVSRVPEGASPDMPPAGEEEAEFERQALEQQSKPGEVAYANRQEPRFDDLRHIHEEDLTTADIEDLRTPKPRIEDKEPHLYHEDHTFSPCSQNKLHAPVDEKHLSSREALITGSERAGGRARRKIDGWVNKARNGYY